MYNYFLILGLQRTGTNWLETLVEKNFDVKLASHHVTGISKHESLKTLIRDRQEFLNSSNIELPNVAFGDENIFYIATYKDYYLWEKSIKRKPLTVYRHHKTKNLREIYDSWLEFKEKIQNKPNVYVRNYVDWLNNWKEIFEEIQEITSWKKTNKEFLSVNKVYQSEDFNINFYKDIKEWK